MKEMNAISTGTVEMNTIQAQLSNPCLVFSISSLLCIVLLLVSGVTMYHVYAKDNLIVTHGIASGDVTDQSAIIWSRANKNSQMNVMYDTDSGFKNPTLVNTNNIVNSTTDYTSADCSF
jgi:alkaline phosphatase D